MKVDVKNQDYTEVGRGDDQRTQIHLIGRDEDDERVHLINDEHRSYFYVPTEEADLSLEKSEHVFDTEDGFESVRGEPLTRVYTYIPGDVPQARKGYTHYEADILYPNRFSLDTGIYGGTVVDENVNENPSPVSLDNIEKADFDAETRVLYCDIEVDDSNGFPDEEKGEEQVISISFYDSFDQEYICYLYHEDDPEINVDTEYIDDIQVEVFDSEVEMLESFAQYIKHKWPDVLAGWNFKKFDAMYLISRFNELEDLDSSDLSPLNSAYNDGWYGAKIRGFSVFDMLKAYKNLQFTELDSFSLDDVAEEELEVSKLNEEDKKIYDMWQNDVNELIEYNIHDVYLTVELERERDIIAFYEEVAGFVGGRLSEMVDFSKAAEMYTLRTVNDMFVVPSSRTIEGGDEEFEGATVFDPATEIKKMVSVLDLKSLYPMSMKTLNAGPRTKDPDGDITAPNGVSFTTEKDSVIKQMIDDLLDERDIKKELRSEHPQNTPLYDKYDMQQRAIKVLMNTLYGILGWDQFRLYDKDVAAAVTATGREVIEFTERKVNEIGYDIVYGDTDSVMVQFDDLETLHAVIHKGYEIEEFINESYQEFAEEELNTDEHWFEMEFEKVYGVFMQAGKKKRYAGDVVFKDGKQVHTTDIVGFEFQRSDYSDAARNLQRKLIRAILRGDSKEEISDLVRDEIEKVKNLDYELDEIGIPGGIGQSFDQYTNKTKTVRGAEYANEHFGEQIQSGDKPKGIYVRRMGRGYPTAPQLSDSKYICWLNQNNVPDSVEIDFDKYLDIQVNGPLSRVIECTEWSWGEIKSGQDQSSIADYGSNGDDMFGEDMEIVEEEDSTQDEEEELETVSTFQEFETEEQSDSDDTVVKEEEQEDENKEEEAQPTFSDYT